MVMSAHGRKRTVILAIFEPTERPLLRKADIQSSPKTMGNLISK